MRKLVPLAIVLAGCGARYTSLLDGGNDAAVAAPDLGDGDMQGVGSSPQLVAAGTFIKGQQNGGDTGSGSATLVLDSGGSERAVFGDDFASTRVPAPEVVLSSRPAIGAGGIQPGDLDLGPLQSASGGQAYALPPEGDGGRRNLFVYCVTFGVDVAVARMQ
jgi:hypothetical protein